MASSSACAVDIDIDLASVSSTSATTSSAGSASSSADVGSPPAITNALRAYFQLEHSLTDLYMQWAAGCARMGQVLPRLPGVRVVRQDPFECLVSFICSSNNNIKRITLMLDSLRRKYGVYLGSLVSVECASSSGGGGGKGERGNGLVWEFRPAEDSDAGSRIEAEARARPFPGTSSTTTSSSSSISSTSTSTTAVTHHDLFAFPTPHALAVAPLPDLRTLGLGYRDKFILQTAELVVKKGRHTWLNALRANPDRLEVQKQLITLSGVGAKVSGIME